MGDGSEKNIEQVAVGDILLMQRVFFVLVGVWHAVVVQHTVATCGRDQLLAEFPANAASKK